MFSVSDGRQTQLSAVMLSEDDSAAQYQTRLTNALRRVGVQVHQQADGIVSPPLKNSGLISSAP